MKGNTATGDTCTVGNRPLRMWRFLRRNWSLVVFIFVIYVVFLPLIFWSCLPKGGSFSVFSDEALTSFCIVSSAVSGVFLLGAVAFLTFVWQTYTQRYSDSVSQLAQRAATLKQAIRAREGDLAEDLRELDSLCFKMQLFALDFRFERGSELLQQLYESLLAVFANVKPGPIDDHRRFVGSLMTEVASSMASAQRAIESLAILKTTTPFLVFSIAALVLALMFSLLAIVVSNVSDSLWSLPDDWNFATVTSVVYLLYIGLLLLALEFISVLRQLWHHFGMESTRWERSDIHRIQD